MRRITLLFTFMLLVLAACGGDDTSEVTISFDTMGGTQIDDMTVGLPNGELDLPSPEKEGYLFEGWYVSDDFIETFDASNLLDTSAITLYAAWDALPADSITVYFDLGVADDHDAITLNPGETVDEPTEPEHSGYHFLGWYDSETFDTSFDFNEPLESDTTIYARWAELFTVRFLNHDGTIMESFEILEGHSAPELDDPSEDGFIFLDWVIDYTSETPFDFSTVIEADTNIYALWLKIFTVTFYVEGDQLDSVDVVEGDTVSLPDAPSKDGHTFTGWTTDALHLEPFEAPYSVYETLNLHANFEANDYTITFETSQGDHIPDLTAPYGSVINAPSVEHVDGYMFVGWYLDEAYTDSFEFDTMPLGDTILYARWIEEGSINTVSFYVDGDLYHEVTVYDGALVVLPDEPTKPGFNFINWLHHDEAFDDTEPVFTHLNLSANFEANDYTITFEDDVSSAITAPYGEMIQAPEDPMLEGHSFAGWYSDEAYEEPFIFETMPLGGAHVYAHFIDDNAPLSVLDVILTQPEYAHFDGLTLMYSEYLENLDGGTHLSMLSDGEHALFALIDFEVPLGSVLSFEATLYYEGDYPIITGSENVIDDGVDASFGYEPQPITLDGLRALEFTPFNVGEVYLITGFMMMDEQMVAMFDPAYERFYPLFNVAMSDQHTADFEALEHGYINIVVTPMIHMMGDEGVPLLYLADAATVESEVVMILDQFELIEALIRSVYANQSIHPWMGLDMPEADPFFGLDIDFEATGPNAALYDAQTDEFGFVDAPTVIRFEMNLHNDLGMTYVFDLDITLEPEPTTPLLDGVSMEMSSVDVVVVAVGDQFIVIQDDSGMISTYVSNPEAFSVGHRYILDVQFMQKTSMLTGMYASIVYEVGPESFDITDTVLSLSDLPNLMLSEHGALQTELEGVLLPGHNMYPLMLYGQDAVVYLHFDAQIDISALMDDLFTHRVSLSGLLHDLHDPTWDSEVTAGYVLYVDDITTLSASALTEQARFELVASWLNDIEMPLRPGDRLELPLYMEMYDMAVAYTVDQTHLTKETTTNMLLLTLDEEATTTLHVSLTMNGSEHTFSIDLVVEDYDLSTIAYAKSIPEGTEVTMRVDVAGVGTFNNYLVLTDETGFILLDGGTVPEWLPFGETIIITGELYTEDEITWLINASFNETYHGDASGTPTADMVDEDDTFALTTVEGVSYIEITGYLTYYNGDLSLIKQAGSAQALPLGLEGGLTALNPFVGETITLRGFLIEDDYFGPSLIFAQRVMTEYTGDITGLYQEADGTKTWMEAYVLSYDNGILYLMDDSGVIEVRGIAEAWALNRIGDKATVYATLVQETNATYLEAHSNWFLNDREPASITDYTPTPVDVTLSDIFEIDTEEKTLSMPIYRVTGTIVDVEGELYLEDGDDKIHIADPLELYSDWINDEQTEQTFKLIMTRSTTLNGDPVLLFIPQS